MHSGTSAERGHYYCYARSSTVASKHSLAPSTSSSGEWILFNDSLVRPSSFESFTSITKTFPTDVAYQNSHECGLICYS